MFLWDQGMFDAQRDGRFPEAWSYGNDPRLSPCLEWDESQASPPSTAKQISGQMPDIADETACAIQP